LDYGGDEQAFISYSQGYLARGAGNKWLLNSPAVGRCHKTQWRSHLRRS